PPPSRYPPSCSLARQRLPFVSSFQDHGGRSGGFRDRQPAMYVGWAPASIPSTEPAPVLTPGQPQSLDPCYPGDSLNLNGDQVRRGRRRVVGHRIAAIHRHLSTSAERWRYLRWQHAPPV